MDSIRLGLGCTILERSLNGAHLDGIGIYNQNLYGHLRDARQVTVMPTCFPPKPWEKPVLHQFPKRIPFTCAYGFSVTSSLVTFLPFAGADSISRKIDVFHAPDHLIPKMKRVPVVATICDAVSVKRPDWIDAGLGGFRSFLVKAATKWASHVIAISTAMVPDLIEHFRIPEKAITVVHLGIGKEWLEPISQAEKAAVLRKYGLVAGYFLFVGTLQPRKNVENILGAYEDLPSELRSNRRLVIVGQPGWNSALLVARLRSMENERTGCSWLQYVPAKDLRAIYQCAGAFVFPSLWEGFGMPILEAYASRIPVITSNLSSLPEIAGSGAILIDPRSVKELRDAMIRLTDTSDLAASLVEIGFARAKEMSWETCTRKTIDVYRRVLG